MKQLVGDLNSVRHAVDEYRIVVVREKAGRWGKWRWAIEEKKSEGWLLRRAGAAWTRQGARAAALRNYERTTYVKVGREELHLFCSWSYTLEKPESPVPAELVA